MHATEKLISHAMYPKNDKCGWGKAELPTRYTLDLFLAAERDEFNTHPMEPCRCEGCLSYGAISNLEYPHAGEIRAPK